MHERLLQSNSTQINWFDSRMNSTCQVGYCDSGLIIAIKIYSCVKMLEYSVNCHQIFWLPHIQLPYFIISLHINLVCLYIKKYFQNFGWTQWPYCQNILLNYGIRTKKYQRFVEVNGDANVSIWFISNMTLSPFCFG